MNFDRERQPQTMVYSDSMPTEIFLKTDHDYPSRRLFKDYTAPKLSNHGSPQRSCHNNRYQENSDSGSQDHLNTNEKQGRFCTNSNILLRQLNFDDMPLPQPQFNPKPKKESSKVNLKNKFLL